MIRFAIALVLCCFSGCACCTVSTGFFVEKDWRTGHEFTSPDLRTRYQIEVKKDF